MEEPMVIAQPVQDESISKYGVENSFVVTAYPPM